MQKTNFKSFLSESASDLQESDAFLTGSKIKMFLLSQVGVTIKGTYDIVDDVVNVKGDVEVRLLRGKRLPFKFGVVKGDFEIRDCLHLDTLEGGPTDAKKFTLKDLPELASLEGSPERVQAIEITRLPKILSLHGMPAAVTAGAAIILQDLKITSLEGLPHYKSVGRIDLNKNSELVDIRHLPKHITYLNIASCDKVQSFSGINEFVESINFLNFDIHRIKKGAIGLTQIKLGTLVITWFSQKIKFASKGWVIIFDHLNRPADVFECQAALIEAGFEDLAQP